MTTKPKHAAAKENAKIKMLRGKLFSIMLKSSTCLKGNFMNHAGDTTYKVQSLQNNAMTKTANGKVYQKIK